MENNYLEIIEQYLKNNNIQIDSNGNITINKIQLLECFLFLQYSKNESKNNEINDIKSNHKKNGDIIKPKEPPSKNPPKQDIINFDNMPLPSKHNKELEIYDANKKNNWDNIPLKGGSNFNDILEKEILKDKINEIGNNENKKIEPKFKYVPKKRNNIT